MIQNKVDPELVIYPWQEQQWQHLIALKLQSRIPHALLFSGVKGLGKLSFAKIYAKSVLCTQFENTSCNKCHACRLFDADNHPDYNLVRPVADSKVIKIEDIRAITYLVNQTSQQSSYKIFIIEPAEKLNSAAANALLKVLEEPAGKTLFILISQHLKLLPATIRSRCQLVKFMAPAIEQGSNWLKAALPIETSAANLLLSLVNFAPVQALELSKTEYAAQRQLIQTDLESLLIETVCVAVVAEKWSKWSFEVIVDILLSFFIDMIRLKSALCLRYISNQDIVSVLQNFANFFTINNLFLLVDKLYRIRYLLISNSNINQQLVIEDLLIILLNRR